MPSPTISLCLIAKNEEKNINRLLDSVEGCFDEIILVDTGSTDKTVEIATSRGCIVSHFKWCDDFSKARNFSFSKATCDYVAWLDLDDALDGRENFIEWKKSAMEFGDLFLNSYHYTIDKDEKPVISFMRERVFKRSINPTWQYPIHEGVIMGPNLRIDYATSWSVKHHRDAQDMAQDKSRNINILENLKKTTGLDPRLQFYYAKELFESGKPNDAVTQFDLALAEDKMEGHDRLLSYQYANYSAQMLGDMIKDDLKEQKNFWYDKAINYSLSGLKHDSARAEFYVAAADSYLKNGDLLKALPMYAAAKNCVPIGSGGVYAGAVFNHMDCYGLTPSLQLAKIYYNLGRLDDAEREASECFEKYKHPEAEKILIEVRKTQSLVKLDNDQVQTEDIVFTCPVNQAYPFDEEIYETKPLGGSETALVQMAKLLKTKTNRNVIVFNPREQELVAKSGVVYKKGGPDTAEYFSKNRPRVHIQWRHNTRLTHAKSYLWCHDLVTATVESVKNFDKMLCLTDFHKSFVMGKQGVSSNQIIVTRNGIDPQKFVFERKPKNPNKVVWMSSPDRGLDRSIKVCDRIREKHPDLELHVYYGLDNLYKYGMKDRADMLKGMMDERPWVKYHGFTEQSKMYHEVSDAVLWCHPCDFVETSCITAMEMLALGVYPVTRSLGGLKNTLADAESKGQATMLPHDCVTEPEFAAYAEAALDALDKKKWEGVSLDLEQHSWHSIADEWIQFMEL